MTDSGLLICSPEGPGWLYPDASVTTVADCNHKVRISAVGVGMLLTTPGMKTCCLFCIPEPKPGDEEKWILPDEIRQSVEEETGEKLTPEFLARMAVWAKTLSGHSKHRR